MELHKTGLLISTLRKEKNMTQKDLAEKIGVTDKAISRWETGRGFPDVSILKPLSEVLSVSISEIVNGEKSTPENSSEMSNKTIIEALSYGKRLAVIAVSIPLIFLGVVLIVLSAAFSGLPITFIYAGISTSLIGLIILCTSSKLKNYNYCNPFNRKGVKISKVILKIIVAIITVVVGMLLGVNLLLNAGFEEICMWILTCVGLGTATLDGEEFSCPK